MKSTFLYRRLLLILSVFTLTMFFYGTNCRRIADPDSGFSFEAVYVDSLIVPETVSANTPVFIRIKGGMPDPSWQFDHFTISTDHSTVYAQPIGKKNLKAGTVPQVIVPYDESFKFTFYRAGPHTIVAAGRVNTLTKRITIEEKVPYKKGAVP